MYLFDTDHLIVLQRRAEPEWTLMRKRMLQHQTSDFHLSIISFHEQLLGANAFIARAKTREGIIRGYQMMERSLIDFGRFDVVPFDNTAASEFHRLRASRIRIGTMDLRIAAIALTNNLTVLTRNAVDFGQVPKLSIEDWTLP